MSAITRLGDLLGALLLIGLALLAALFLIVPMAVAVLLSFDDRAFLGHFPPPAFSFRWYQALIENPNYVKGLAMSLQLAFVSTAIAVATGVCAAIALMRLPGRRRALVESLLLSPKFVPTVVIGFGILAFTARLGLHEPFLRLVMGHVIITLPFTVRATLASLGGIRGSLVEAAQSLGATPLRAHRDVTLPLARTGIVAGALMAFVLSFDEVAVSLFLSDAFTQTLPIALVAEMRANLNLSIAAMATLFMVVVVAIVIILDRTLGLDRVVGQGVYRS